MQKHLALVNAVLNLSQFIIKVSNPEFQRKYIYTMNIYAPNIYVSVFVPILRNSSTIPQKHESAKKVFNVPGASYSACTWHSDGKNSFMSNIIEIWYPRFCHA